MPATIRNLKLIRSDDCSYKKNRDRHQYEDNFSHAAEYKSENRPALSLFSSIAESVVRHWYNQQLPLLMERVLSFQEWKCNTYQQIYLEIDAVERESSLSNGTIYPRRFIEIKTSANINMAVLAARKQLNRRLSIARRQWADVEGLALIVNLLGQTSSSLRQISLNDDLAQVVETADPSKAVCPCLLLDGREIWDKAVDQGLVSDMTLWDSISAEAMEVESDRASRQALKDSRVPYAEWPLHLKGDLRPETKRTFTFGESSKGSALSLAFAKALQESG